MTTVGTELYDIETYIYGRLSGDSALTAAVAARIYPEKPDEDAAYPLVVFARQSGLTMLGNSGAILWGNYLYQAEVWGETRSLNDLKAAADRIDALLHNPDGATVNGARIVSLREQPMGRNDDTEGVFRRSAGGLYRILYDPA